MTWRSGIAHKRIVAPHPRSIYRCNSGKHGRPSTTAVIRIRSTHLRSGFVSTHLIDHPLLLISGVLHLQLLLLQLQLWYLEPAVYSVRTV